MACESERTAAIVLGICSLFLLLLVVFLSLFLHRVLGNNKRLIDNARLAKIRYARDAAANQHQRPFIQARTSLAGERAGRSTSSLVEMTRITPKSNRISPSASTSHITNAQLKQNRTQPARVQLGVRSLSNSHQQSGLVKSNPLARSTEDLEEIKLDLSDSHGPSRRSSFGETVFALTNSLRRKKSEKSTSDNAKANKDERAEVMKQAEHLPDEKGPDQLLVSRPTLKSSPKFEIKQDKALSSVLEIDWPDVESDSDESRTIDFDPIEQARKESVGSLVSLQRKQTARREDPPEAARLAKLMSMDSEMSNEEKSLSLGSRQLKLRNRHGSSASDEITGFQDLESDSEDAVDLQYQSNNVTLTEPKESSHEQDLDADDEDETVHF